MPEPQLERPRASLRQRFGARYPFGFDRFQIESFDAIDRGEHTVVAAPTGSGKTVIAEYGIESAIENGRRSFYTTPIKALSNQKFRDLGDRYGAERVGLLTGDHSINADAEIVVMTTEVLRNMIYAENRLDDLGLVVIDEVHFLQDAYRGPVWEEVIIQLPEPVRLVCLSATVSNADELAEWIQTVRGPSRAVVETHRPVPLEQRYLVDDLERGETRAFPTLVKGKPNPAVERLTAARSNAGRGQSQPGRSGRGRTGRARSALATPDRFEVLNYLRSQQLLPAVHFVFSRRGCTDAAQACVHAGVRLNDDVAREQLLTLAEQRVAQLSDADLAAVGYDDFVDQLSIGVAAHHAGMIPAFKEVVELGFLAGWIRLVYATETLAVGVNMPARAVVIDKLSKYNGEHHEILSPAQFTQLSGRAGRRGMDTEGTVVVLFNPYVGFDAVASLAAADGFALRSAFRPTYNMAANLVARYDEQRARQFLSLSFAQYQADRHVVLLERQIVRLERKLAEQVEAAGGADRLTDLRDLRPSNRTDRAQTDRPATGRPPSDPGDDDPIELELRVLKPGDVVAINKGTFKGPAAVVATARRAHGTKVTVITPSASVVTLGPDDWQDPPMVIAHVVLPGSFSPHQRRYRTEVGQRVKAATLGKSAAASRGGGTRRRADPDSRDSGQPRGKAPTAAGVVDADRAIAAAAVERTERDLAALRRRVTRRDGALAAELNRVVEVLDGFGFLERERWALTESGEMLRKIFHENDLLIARSLEAGVFDDLDAPELAGLVSVFVYEHRSPDDPPPPWFSSGVVAERWARITQLSDEQARRERAANRNEHRRPDPTMFAAVHGWVAGGGLNDVLDDEMTGGDLTGGDFVRSIRQLSDLLEQIGQVAPLDATRATARWAARAAYRDVVADSGAGQPLTAQSAATTTGETGRGE